MVLVLEVGNFVSLETFFEVKLCGTVQLTSGELSSEMPSYCTDLELASKFTTNLEA